MRYLLLLLLIIPSLSFAQSDKSAFRSTKYPLPRFVSLRSNEVFARTGPGKQYPIRFVYERRNLPVEVVLEYEGWRKVKDYDGDEGWIHQSLLSGKRTAIIRGTETISLYRKAKETARQVAKVEAGSIVMIEGCERLWCKLNASGYEGWAHQKYLWGIYDNEEID